MADFDIILNGSKKVNIHSMDVTSEDNNYTVFNLYTKRYRHIGYYVLYIEKGILYNKFLSSKNFSKFMDKLKLDNGWI